jgi:hypothetical protein
MGKGQRVRKKRAAAGAKQARPASPSSDAESPVRLQMPRPNATTFTSITVVPSFPPEHPLGGTDLPPGGSPGSYVADAVLGVPGASRSAFTDVDWSLIAAEGDSLIEVPGSATGMTQSWHRGGPGGDQIISYEFGLNAERRLATATTRLDAEGFQAALVTAQDVLESYLSVLSFHHDVPIEAVAWRVTEERTGAVRLAMKHLGQVKALDLSLTMLSSPGLRELLSTWREAMNAENPMSQALGLYKIIERVHKYRVDRVARTRDTDRPYLPSREVIPQSTQSLLPDYKWASDAFTPYLGKKFTLVWNQDLRERIRNAVAHLREEAPSLTPDRAADVETCRQAVPVLHYIAYTMLQREISDQEQWPESDATPPGAAS